MHVTWHSVPSMPMRTSCLTWAVFVSSRGVKLIKSERRGWACHVQPLSRMSFSSTARLRLSLAWPLLVRPSLERSPLWCLLVRALPDLA